MKETIIHGTKGDYVVTNESCTCPDYVYRRKDMGGKCKHMESLE